MIEDILFIILGLSVLIHIAFVSVTLGVGLITAIYRYLAYKRNDVYLEAFARRSFRLLIVSELMSGVWGTIITVVLAGFFPSLVALATNVLFTPIAVAIASIMIRIPSIAIFWYTWGRVSPGIHSIIGFIMALSGFGVPLGFRTIFAEITAPHAVASYLTTGTFGAFQAYTSPLFWTLYTHTVLAVISVGAFMVITVAALDRDLRGVSIAYKYAVGALLLQPIAGLAYYIITSREAPYIAERIVAGAFAPAFYLKMLLVLTLLYGSYKLYTSLKNGSLPTWTPYLGPLAMLVAVLGEFVNDGSRHPYMVVMDSTGVPIEAFFNYYISFSQVAPAVAIVLLFLITGLFIFMLAAYYAIVKRYVV